MIPFNKPFLSGNETVYITKAVESGKISGDGMFTRKCHSYLEDHFGFKKCLLTTSCTDALEMAAILIDVQPGDEIILPSYTFVSTANAFVLRGAKLIFCDSGLENPNIDTSKIEALISSKTKAIVAVHYAGMACDMDEINAIANRYNLFVIEDAAQAFDSYYKGKPLGSLGHLAAFSFHETKNIQCGEGGMLVINDEQFIKRAEIIREKGTNRSAFFRGEVDKYNWVDVGSSFLPSDIIAAYLFAQLEMSKQIQAKRLQIWNKYQIGLMDGEEKGNYSLPSIPDYATNNAHMFFLVCNSSEDREGLINALKSENIMAVFHYLSLHKSPYFSDKHEGESLTNADSFSDKLVRLPLYYELSPVQQDMIIDSIKKYYSDKQSVV